MPVSKDLPCTSLISILGLTLTLLVAWTFLKKRVDTKGSFKLAHTLSENYDFITASASAVLAAYVIDIGHDVLTTRTDLKVNPYTLGYIYHILKIFEYGDIITALLAGDTQIQKHSAFTHLALPFWSLYRVVLRPHDSLDWRFQVIVDCLARVLKRLIPWLVENVRTEETLLGMIEEIRWYPDLAINALWMFFTYSNQRDDSRAVEIFGLPYEEEVTSRMLGVAVLLYASISLRQDREKNMPKQATAPGVSPVTSATRATPMMRR